MHSKGSLSHMFGILILIMGLCPGQVFGAFCPAAAKSNAVCGATDSTGKLVKARGPDVDKKGTDFTCKNETFNTPICCSVSSGEIGDRFKELCGGAPQGAKRGFVKKPITNS
ncbi:hypothetical protein VP01_3208g1 [Puccinia sorghi]|uniref:Uncharacterized protein n=1 Tax=Puccinia sorghi TaxID=27349 RepID=A0A0L6V095_9BASI|nr:hypothetical protein VP01_3208g1 [Puccinia sorghi]